ncbi:MAG: ClpXP adapter SpxH family protein [Bacteroidota bacterium]
MKQPKSFANPLLCDPETGVCEIPAIGGEAEVVSISRSTKPIKVLYYTDPICSSCWGIEPQLRKLKLTYGHQMEIEYRMGGLLPDWSYNSGGISQPSDVAHHWDEVSLKYDMPIDGDVWLEDPLDSSYPPSIAVKAAQMQDASKAVKFLRKLREYLFLQKNNITRWEWVERSAEAVGLDIVKLKADYEDVAKELFQEDLALARQLRVRGFPSLFFTDQAGNTEFVYGTRPYESYEQAIHKLFPEAKAAAYQTDWASLFAHYPTLTIKEFSVLAGMARAESEQMLNELVQQGNLQRLDTKHGPLFMG